MAVQAISGIIQHHQTHPTWPALAAAALSIVVKEALYRVTVRAGRRMRSQAVIANAWHHRSDALSSVAVLVGVGAAMLNPDWHILDQVAALLVALLIVKVGGDITWKAVCEMTDRAPSRKVLERIRGCVIGVPGVLSAHDIKVRLVGGLLHMHVHVVVDGGMTVNEGHRIADEVRHCLHREIDEMADVIVHVDPAGGTSSSGGDHDG